MMHELIALTGSLAKVSEQAHRRTEAGRLRELAEDRLTKVHARLQAGETSRRLQPAGPTLTPPPPAVDLDQLDPELRTMVERVRGGQASPTEATRSPVPNPLQKAPERRTATEHEADRGVGR